VLTVALNSSCAHNVHRTRSFASHFFSWWRNACELFELAVALVDEASGAGVKGGRARSGGSSAPAAPAPAAAVAVSYVFSSVAVSVPVSGGGGDKGVVSRVDLSVERGPDGLRLVLPQDSPLALVEEQLCADFSDLNRPLHALERGARGLAALSRLVAVAAPSLSGGVPAQSACEFRAWSSTAGELALRAPMQQGAGSAMGVSFFSPDTVVVSGVDPAVLVSFFESLKQKRGDSDGSTSNGGAGDARGDGARMTCSGAVAVPIDDFVCACEPGAFGELPPLLEHLMAVRS
jgi:hypothetical protein